MRMSPRVFATFCVAFALCSLERPVRVHGEPQDVVVTVRPSTGNLAVNQTRWFQAIVTGTANREVTWSVDGGGINGTIRIPQDADSARALFAYYTAPAVVPDPPTVTVRATSVAEPGKSGMAMVTVRWLGLFSAENVRVIAKMNPDRRSFTNYVVWNDPFWDRPSSDASFFVHPPDTAGWRARSSTTPPDSLSRPSSGGRYTGTVDRTFQFAATEGGRVGVGVPGPEGRPSLTIRCDVLGGREDLTGTIDIGRGYTPGTPKRVVFTPGPVDLGFTVSFSPGLVDSNGVFKVGAEDFEGYHIFRATGTEFGANRDFSNIGEVSKEEAFRGDEFDAIYFGAALPALRSFGVYTLPAPVPGFGSTIDVRDVLPAGDDHPAGRLGPDELLWVDRNAFNGFTYYYLVTTFDKGYSVGATSQGIEKFDNCDVTQGQSVPCPSELVKVSTQVEPLWNLPEIYAVPNPYRDPAGTSQHTTQNYHNFPDNKMRFVNVPAWCKFKIYTPAGDLVWEFDQVEGPGVIEWDTKNRGGVAVASGIYIYRVEAKSGNWMYGRIVIIR